MTSQKPIALPPGVKEGTFVKFIGQIRDLLGAENVDVISPGHSLNDGSYANPPYTHDPHHVLDQDYFLASAVVAPRTVQDVQ